MKRKNKLPKITSEMLADFSDMIDNPSRNEEKTEFFDCLIKSLNKDWEKQSYDK